MNSKISRVTTRNNTRGQEKFHLLNWIQKKSQDKHTPKVRPFLGIWLSIQLIKSYFFCPSKVTNIKELFDRQMDPQTDVVGSVVNVYQRKAPNDYHFIGQILTYKCTLEPFSSPLLVKHFAVQLHGVAVHGWH